MSDEIVAEALSRFASIRVTIVLDEATIAVERWHQPGSHVEATGTLSADEVESIRSLAAKVRQEEESLIVGDFYADGEERLKVSVGGRRVELHNDSDRIRTPGAQPLLTRCYELADRVLPRPN
ncbi:MAG: hypothetical protein JJ863_05695 [Deltaproteobacteria bacterium]|nr:hypothetical protein [Deltaproteobacteria bacterium]